MVSKHQITDTRQCGIAQNCCLESKGVYGLLAVIAGKEVTIRTDVVDSDLPLLL